MYTDGLLLFDGKPPPDRKQTGAIKVTVCARAFFSDGFSYILPECTKVSVGKLKKKIEIK